MQCTTESPVVRSAPPSSPELHCVLAVQQWGGTGHLVKPCSPAECKWAAITWVLMTHLNKDEAATSLCYSPELLYYKVEAFGLVSALWILPWLCVS